MLVKDIMTRHPILISPETPASEAQKIMTENKIRHLPVVGDGKRLLGLLTRERLSLKPDMLASLDVWEITRYMSDLTAQKLMLKQNDVKTISPDRTVERAAKVMTEHKIGGLPVLEEEVVVGVISEVDLLNALQEMLGLPVEGVRVTMRMPNLYGEFSKLTGAISAAGLGVMGIGSCPTPRMEGFYDMVLKIPHATVDQVRGVLLGVEGQEIVDIRVVV